MPTFSEAGNDEYICQMCGEVFDAVFYPSQWRPDITGSENAGNVCSTCAKGIAFDEARLPFEGKD